MYNFIVMLDITQTADGDVELGTGDLTYTESTGQHKRDLLLADKDILKKTRTGAWGLSISSEIPIRKSFTEPSGRNAVRTG